MFNIFANPEAILQNFEISSGNAKSCYKKQQYQLALKNFLNCINIFKKNPTQLAKNERFKPESAFLSMADFYYYAAICAKRLNSKESTILDYCQQGIQIFETEINKIDKDHSKFNHWLSVGLRSKIRLQVLHDKTLIQQGKLDEPEKSLSTLNDWLNESKQALTSVFSDSLTNNAPRFFFGETNFDSLYIPLTCLIADFECYVKREISEEINKELENALESKFIEFEVKQEIQETLQHFNNNPMEKKPAQSNFSCTIS